VAAGSVGEWEIHELARRRATRMGASLISVYSMSLTRMKKTEQPTEPLVYI
jgi:hypothetical protein